MPRCQGHHVTRERGDHDEGTCGIGSKIKRVLPDGNIITVDAKRFHCADVLLQQYFINKICQRIPRDFSPDVLKCDVYIGKESYTNVVCQVARPCSEVLLSS